MNTEEAPKAPQLNYAGQVMKPGESYNGRPEFMTQLSKLDAARKRMAYAVQFRKKARPKLSEAIPTDSVTKTSEQVSHA